MVNSSMRSLAILSLIASASVAGAEVFHIAELNTRQILELDRDRTIVIIPGGILEEHGPYLPSMSDGYVNLDESNRLAGDLSDRGWTTVMFPLIPLGSGGANEVGGQYVFPGTYAIRPDTLRAIFMDLATELGEQRFRYIFVLHGHGSPAHNLALDQAGQYFRDEYGGEMHNLAGYLTDSLSAPELLTEDELAENGFSVHAGVMETSHLLHLRPDLVGPDVGQAEPVTGQRIADLMELGAEADWPGYFGSPRLATADIGHAIAEKRYRANLELALRVLDGDDLSDTPRWSVIAYQREGTQAVISGSRAEHSRRAERQNAWIRRTGSEL